MRLQRRTIANIVAAAILLEVVNCAWGSRILAIFPTPSYSHQIVLNRFAKELNRRGHEIVVLTPNPDIYEKSENYTEIALHFNYKTQKQQTLFGTRQDGQCFLLMKLFLDRSHGFVRDIFEETEFRKVYAPESGEKFDLVIVEALTHQALFGLAHRFDAPLIGVATLGLGISYQYAMGNPIMTSHPSLWELESMTGSNLSLWKRIRNFFHVWKYYYEHQTEHLVKQNILSKEYLGKDTPDIWEIQKNTSLLLTNQDLAISYVTPSVPNIIQFGGFHISKTLKPLPKDLNDFLDGAKNGFIYTSLGSNVNSQSLTNKTISMFLQVFSKVPQRVLWKFETELPEKPENVFISKWLPQQTVLNHPNIKLFVYQGGLQSTEEAVHYEVPLLGFPFFCDQYVNVNKMVDNGVAKRLEILAVEEVEFEETIRELIENKKYKENMVKLNAIVKDKPYDPLQNALWWTEFVIRHKGAPHLRSTLVEEVWYQRFDMDVIAILAILIFVTIVILSVIFIKLIMIGYGWFQYLIVNSNKQKML